MFQGSIVALVSPMTASGQLDEKRVRELIQLHLDQGTEGIVVNGTTGESPTLNESERHQLIKIAVELARSYPRKVTIIAGTGTNDTFETIRQTKAAEKLGVDACLLVTPYYNRPTQEGLYQHYKVVAEAVSLPLLLYNVSQRTGCDLLPETVARLSLIPNIVGIKEASSDLTRGRKLRELCGNTFVLLSGDDASALAFMLQGGKGVVSVTANIMPKLMHEMCMNALSGNIQRAGILNTQLMPLHKTLGIESNPIPVKWVMHQMGWIEEGIRLPLTNLSEPNQAILRDAMKRSGVIN